MLKRCFKIILAGAWVFGDTHWLRCRLRSWFCFGCSDCYLFKVFRRAACIVIIYKWSVIFFFHCRVTIKQVCKIRNFWLEVSFLLAGILDYLEGFQDHHLHQVRFTALKFVVGKECLKLRANCLYCRCTKCLGSWLWRPGLMGP